MATSNSTRVRQEPRSSFRAGLTLSVILLAGSAQAQTEPSPAFKPSEAQIERTIASILVCQWPLDPRLSSFSSEFSTVLRYLEQKRTSSLESEDGLLPGRFKALGVDFDRVAMLGFQGGGVAIGWSAASTRDQLAEALRKQGYEFKAHEASGGLAAEKVTPDSTARLLVVAGRQTMRGKEGAEGATILCRPGPTTDEASMAAAGVPSTETVREVVRKGAQKDKAWVDNIIARRAPGPLAAIAGYSWLDADQVATMLALNSPAVNHALVRNAHVPLTAQQIDPMLDTDVVHSILKERYGVLSEPQRQRLRVDPRTSLVVTLRGGGADARAAFETVLQKEMPGRVEWALQMLPEVTEEIVDLVLVQGTEEIRGRFVMQSRYHYTQQQVERMLRDENVDVQIGVLRRDDIPLTEAQIARGINHHEEKIAFWYRQRKGYVPTEDQIEKGLTSTNVVTRRGWAGYQRVLLTDGQVGRALTDPDPVVRKMILSRPEIQLNAAQQDTCTTDPDFGARTSCVGRQDYTLTQARFQAIASDRNPNVLRAFLNRKDIPSVDLGPYIAEAIRNASNDTLLAVAENRAIVLTDAQIRMAREMRAKRVGDAFCRRSSHRCQ